LSFFQDLHGVAEAADPNDELDVTATQVKEEVASIAEVAATSTKAKVSDLAAAAMNVTGSADGLSMGQKLFFVGAIAALCALFLKSRNGGQGSIVSGGLKEKSMA
jgi:peptidyl-prolyl cis-trans isomerase B (cyclophilin B)